VRPPLSPTMHGMLEYAAAPIWALAPGRLGLTELAAALSWTLAGGVLAAATLTRYPLGIVKVVPLRVHAWVDRCATPLVMAAPWIAGFSEVPAARNLFLLMGGVGLVVTIATDFDEARNGRRPFPSLQNGKSAPGDPVRGSE
jgi:hypothetical protein